MRHPAGQVAASVGRVMRGLMGLSLLLLLGCAALGWRLAQGPIELPMLARLIEEAANRQGTPRLEVAHVSVGWDGWRGAGLTPLEFRLNGVRIGGGADHPGIEMPDASLSLALPWLLRGELAPRRIEIIAPVLRLRRDADGQLTVALAGAGDTEGTPAEVPAATATLDRLLTELMRPPNEDSPRGALARLAVRDARVLVEDAQLGTQWSLEGATIEAQRLPGGGIAARGTGTLALGTARLPVSVAGEARGEPALVGFRMALAETRPAALAGLAPMLAPLAALDAPASVELAGRLDGDGRLALLEARLSARAGTVDVGAARRVPIAGLDLRAAWRPDIVTLERAVLRLDGPGTPGITATAEARRGGPGWQASARIALDAAPLGELARWWPEGLGGNERDWILENITAGTGRNGAWALAAEAAADGSGLTITDASGTLEVEDATVHWLRPMPPVEAARGVVEFGTTAVVARVAAARQSGTQMLLRDAVVRLGFAPGEVPSADIQLPVTGPLADTLGVLQHPRLRLFENRPMPLKEPSGTLDGRIAVGFPLLADLPVEQLRVRAEARLANARIADILLGRPIERGQFQLAVDNDGLRVNGTAQFAEMAARIGVTMDFRSGPPSQIVSRETVTLRAEARQLAALDLAHEDVVRGPVGLDVRTERRRNGQGRVTVRGDLRDATLAIGPLAWNKPPGQNAGGEAVLRLRGESLAAIESFRIEAPALLLRGSATFGPGTRLERVTFAEARVEESRLSGDASPPAQRGGSWTVGLRGPVLDLRRAMTEETPAPAPGAAATGAPPAGPAIALRGRFERVLLGPRRELAALDAQVLVDGSGVVREGRLLGRAGPRGPFEVAIAPRPGQGGRTLRVTADDAGALLGAFGVLEHLEGGRLRVSGAYAHDGPGAPLSGTAEMDDFAVRNAPGFAKLLQAMTLYGLVEALSGPGLNFLRMVAPFTLTPETLALDEARAFSASLGLTAKGVLDRRRQRLAMEGTIVPAYIINSLLGNIPLLGRIFSPETGGGLFAATFSLRGPMDDPQVSVNPLAALTPGFLRGIFGIGQTSARP